MQVLPGVEIFTTIPKLFNISGILSAQIAVISRAIFNAFVNIEGYAMQKKILLAFKERKMREGLRSLLQEYDEFEVAAEADSCESTVALAERGFFCKLIYVRSDHKDRGTREMKIRTRLHIITVASSAMVMKSGDTIRIIPLSVVSLVAVALGPYPSIVALSPQNPHC